MGVSNLWTLLEPVGRRINVEALTGKRVAVDASIWLIQFLKAMRDDNGDVVQNAHLLGFFRRICRLLFHRIRPVFVFDGATPALKRRTVLARRRRREQNSVKLKKTAEKLLMNKLNQRALAMLIDNNEEVDAQLETNVPSVVERLDDGANDVAASTALESIGVETTSMDVTNRGGGESIISSGGFVIDGTGVENKAMNPDAPMESDLDDHDSSLCSESSGDGALELPDDPTSLDPDVLFTLPPSIQYEIILKMREKQFGENREKFVALSGEPENFSNHQMSTYLKASKFRRELEESRQKAANVVGQDGLRVQKIASEPNREYVLHAGPGDSLGLQQKPKNAKQTLSAMLQVQDTSIIEPSTTSVHATVPPGTLDITFDASDSSLEEDIEWEDEEYTKASMTEVNKQDNLLGGKEERPLRQKYWSQSHGFKLGRSLAQWGEEEGGGGEEIGKGGNIDEETLIQVAIQRSLEDAVHGTAVQQSSNTEGTPMSSSWPPEASPRQYADEGPSDRSRPQDASGPALDHSLTGVRVVEFETEPGKDCSTSFPSAQGTLNCVPRVPPKDELGVQGGGDKMTTEAIRASKDITHSPERGEMKKSREEIQMEETSHISLVDEGSGEVIDVEADGSSMPLDGSSKALESGSMCSPAVFKDADTARLASGVQQDGKGGCTHQENTCLAKDSLCSSQLTGPSLAAANPGDACLVASQDPGFMGQEDDQLPVDNADLRKNGAESSRMDGEGNDVDRIVEVNVSGNKTHDKRENPEPKLGHMDQGKNGNSPNPRVDPVIDLASLTSEGKDLEIKVKQLNRNAETPTPQMYAECQELLQMFGLPYIIAPMEAEAQCAFLNKAGLVDGVITEDNDVFLFGATSVYKHLFEDRKYVEEYNMQDIESELGLDRSKLIQMAMLLGSDYTEGIAGIGIVNATEIVQAFDCTDGLTLFKEWLKSPDEDLISAALASEAGKNVGMLQNKNLNDPPALQDFKLKHRKVKRNWMVPDSFPNPAIAEAYTNPKVDTSTAKITYGRPDLEMLQSLCREKFGWDASKVDELIVPVLKAYDNRQTQLRIDSFVAFRERFAKIKSKRLQKAVSGITGSDTGEIALNPPSLPAPSKKARRKRKALQNQDALDKSTAEAVSHTKKLRPRRRKKAEGDKE